MERKQSGDIKIPDFCVGLYYSEFLDVTIDELSLMKTEEFAIRCGWREGKLLADTINHMESINSSQSGGKLAGVKR